MSALAGKVFFYAVSAAGTGLGIWQVQRYHWKSQRIDEGVSRARDPAVPIPCSSGETCNQKEIFDRCKALMRKRVALSGRYIEGHDVLLGLRSAPLSNGRQAAQGMAVNPQGYFVFSPFQLTLDGSGDASKGSKEAVAGPIIYVNRGWVGHRQEKWGIRKSPLRIECVVTEAEKGSAFSPPHDIASRKLLWLDTVALVEASGLGSTHAAAREEMMKSGVTLVDLVGVETEAQCASKDFPKSDAETVTELPIPKEPYNALTDYYVTPATHAAYAFTWFSLAICSLAVSYFKFRKTPATAAQLRRLKNNKPKSE